MPDGGRLLFTILFWFGLATCVELWWLGLGGSVQAVASAADALSADGFTADGLAAGADAVTVGSDGFTAGGRLTGLVAGFLLLVQVLLMSRAPVLERWVGAHALLGWHRRIGAALLVTVLTHAAMILVGYARIAGEPVTGQAWTMLTGYADMPGAFLAAGLLVVVALLAVRAIRRALPYELWHALHLAAYAVLLLGYGHQFRYGQELVGGGFGWWYWVGLHTIVLAFLAWGRIASPLLLNLRHGLRVRDVVPEGPDTVSIYLDGRRLDRFPARAGQFLRWRFLSGACWWQAHPFSLSAAPNRRWLRLTVKAVGRYSAELRRLPAGARVLAYGPSGAFTAERRVRPRALLIAGGSGIAPVRALLEELPPGAAVIYRASTEADLVFREELDWLAAERGLRVSYVVGARDDPRPRRALSPAGLRELVPDVRQRDVYLCGPPGLVAAARKALRRLRVPRRQIHLDPFEL